MQYFLYIFIFCLSIGYISQGEISAATEQKEEQVCLDILQESINNDSRFRGIDISRVKKDDRDNLTYDVSDYDVFTSIRSMGGDNGSYRMRRNNIGTIIRENDYIITQFVTFGDRSTFKFPIPTEIGITQLGDDFGEFRDKLIYTHHLYAPGHNDNGAFLSCGFLKLEPKPGFGLSDLHPQNYMTNDIMESGFELVYGPNSPKTSPVGDYIVGKVRVPVKNWPTKDHPKGRDLMNIELITVAYDNQSEVFNEYETFPLQVKAMTDMDLNPRNVVTVQERFLSRVKQETCLTYTHAGTWDLPSICNGTYKSLTKKIIPESSINPEDTNTGTTSTGSTSTGTTGFNELIQRVLSWFSIPTTHARLDMSDITPREGIPSAGSGYQGMYYDDAIPYSYMEKLDKISDPYLKEYIRMALMPEFEKILEDKKAEGMNLTEYEEAFLACDIPYIERMQNIKAFLADMDPERFDATNISYINPRIGDCIIPLPDKRHRDLIITGSFLHNQKIAAVMTDNTAKIRELDVVFAPDTLGMYDQYKTYFLYIGGFLLILLGFFLVFRLMRRP